MAGDCCNESEIAIHQKRAYLLNLVKTINNLTAGEIDKTHLLDNPKNKGRIGQVVQIYLGKELDNSPTADFPEAKLELKVTGLIRDGNSFKAKERLVLHMINYENDYDVSFEDSSVLEKCRTLLITCYIYLTEHIGEKPDYRNFPFVDSFIYDITQQEEDDFEVIKDDYEEILEKIASGHADRISESDTRYLVASTKASDSTKLRRQHNSDILAKPRAFSLKPSYLTTIIRKYISNEQFESIYHGKNKSERKGIDETIIERLSPWKGYEEEDLAKRFNSISKSKDKFARILSGMLNLRDIQKTEEFEKANIKVKAVRVEENGEIREHMSFPAMDFLEIANEEWKVVSEEGENIAKCYSDFIGLELILCVFKKRNGTYFFDDWVFYRIPDFVVIDFIRYTYNRTRDVLMSGNIVKEICIGKDGKVRRKTNFVGSKENPVCHVRPHAQNANDSYPLPVPDKMTGLKNFTKQCFWFDRKFIQSIIEHRADEYLIDAQRRMDFN